jgi:hypothetical protein
LKSKLPNDDYVIRFTLILLLKAVVRNRENEFRVDPNFCVLLRFLSSPTWRTHSMESRTAQCPTFPDNARVWMQIVHKVQNWPISLLMFDSMSSRSSFLRSTMSLLSLHHFCLTERSNRLIYGRIWDSSLPKYWNLLDEANRMGDFDFKKALVSRASKNRLEFFPSW